VNETQIHKAVVQNLVRRGEPNVFWFHPANGGKRSWSEGKSFKAMGVVAGVPDLIILKGGECFALELKAPGGRIQPSQRLCQAAMQDAGVKTATAKGLDEALITLEVWGILKRDSNRRVSETLETLGD
jgi:hypothetical protein